MIKALFSYCSVFFVIGLLIGYGFGAASSSAEEVRYGEMLKVTEKALIVLKGSQGRDAHEVFVIEGNVTLIKETLNQQNFTNKNDMNRILRASEKNILEALVSVRGKVPHHVETEIFRLFMESQYSGYN